MAFYHQDVVVVVVVVVVIVVVVVDVANGVVDIGGVVDVVVLGV